MCNRVCRYLLLLLAVSSATLAVSAELTDPMRPPASYRVQPQTEAAPPVSGPRWQLHSVLLGDQRAVAVIDGVPVSRGEWYRGARLVKVSADKVTLQGRDGKKTVLKLTPAVHKKVSADMEIRPK